MSIFRKSASFDKADITQVKGQDDREKSGPLQIGNDSKAMAERLSAERERVVSGGNSCCVAVCMPDPMQGMSVEQAVAETARRFANSLRAYDSIFLRPGNRILVCAPFVKSGDAPGLMERLRDLASRMPVTLSDGTSGHVMVSVGGVMMDRSANVEETIRRADKAMEQGKLSGNRMCLWSPDLL